jgi:hypothetical protein
VRVSGASRKVPLVFRTADDPDGGLVVKLATGKDEIADPVFKLFCPFCGATAIIAFRRPPGEWPAAVVLVCDGGRHRVDERQPQRAPLSIAR